MSLTKNSETKHAYLKVIIIFLFLPPQKYVMGSLVVDFFFHKNAFVLYKITLTKYLFFEGPARRPEI